VKPNNSTVIWQATNFTPASSTVRATQSRGNAAILDGLLHERCSDILETGMPAISRFGMFQLMLWNHFGPNGISWAWRDCRAG